jgi:chromosomal replication initiation ATPase DnaA
MNAMTPTACYRFDLPPGVLIDGRSFVADVETLRAMAAEINRTVDPFYLAGDRLLERIAAHWDVNVHDMRGKRRHYAIVKPRWHFALLAVTALGWSHRDADRYFGWGHGSALYGTSRLSDWMETDNAIKAKVEAFKV